MNTLSTTLSPIKIQIYDFIVAYRKVHKNSPTRREIAEAVGNISTNTVNYQLARMAGLGMIRWEPKRARMIEPVKMGNGGN